MERSFSPALVLYSADLKKSLRFYRAAGLVFKRERHDGGPWHYACDFGGFALELYRSRRRAASYDAPQKASRLVFYVHDIEAVTRRIARLTPNYTGTIACSLGLVIEAIDPDGHDILFIQR